MKNLDLNHIKAELSQAPINEIIKWAIETFGQQRLVMASSMGAEDQLLTHYLMEQTPIGRVFFLDTGRHFQETYDCMQATMNKYQFDYEVIAPLAQDIELLIKNQGPNGFYQSIENRKSCCYCRKVKGLKRVLATADAWITGLRADQAVTRSDVNVIEWDEQFGIYKINPLYNWNEQQVWARIKEQAIPVNALHATGFPSIGCQPCTRAIAAGEDKRAGRWWWEQPEQKECGLHISEGKLVRKKTE